MHEKSIKMRSGTLWAASWKQVGSGSAPEMTVLVLFSSSLAKKCDFGSHFGSPVDFEGGPKITFLVIMLEKTGKKEVREGLRQKHEIWMDFGCQNGRLREAKIMFLVGTLLKNQDFGDSEIS